MAIETWMPAITTRLGAITGLDGGARDYRDLPATVAEFPILLILPESGSGFYGQGSGAVDVHIVRALLLQPSQILSEAAAVLVPFIARFQAKVAANLTLGGLVDHWLLATQSNWYEGPQYITWAKQEYFGIVFRMEIKERSNVVVTP